MRIRYVIQFNKPIVFEDCWPIPFMGGELRVVLKDRKATGLEVTFTGKPLSYSPSMQINPAGTSVAATINDHDTFFPLVRARLLSAFAFLQCYHDVQLMSDETDVEYLAETEAEKVAIQIHRVTTGQNGYLSSVTFDMLTRSILISEKVVGPSFESALVSAARTAVIEGRYIDSFRHSFLLIELLYGGGKFKNVQLRDFLKRNSEFVSLVTAALKERLWIKRPTGSDTEKLLSSKPSAEVIIDHLVTKRGFYFHGNVNRKDAWKPHDQADAEALSLIALEISMAISHAAAAPMFQEYLSRVHFNQAKLAGAIMSLKVNFKFKKAQEKIDRNDSMTIKVPGTVITPRMAQYVAQQFLARFEHGAPAAALKSASCVVESSGQKVFDIEFHVGNVASNP